MRRFTLAALVVFALVLTAWSGGGMAASPAAEAMPAMAVMAAGPCPDHHGGAPDRQHRACMAVCAMLCAPAALPAMQIPVGFGHAGRPSLPAIFLPDGRNPAGPFRPPIV